MVDPNQLELAVLNLCVNARDAMPDGGELWITADIAEISPDSGVDLPFFPAIVGKGIATFSLDATHTVPIGQYVESAPEAGE